TNNPPKYGPLILPILMATPHRIFPAGSRFAGSKSVINEIPRENNDPTNIPEIANKINNAAIDDSNNPAKKKQIDPAIMMSINVFVLPILSLKASKGS